jgi:predicted GH43/DUF377 family glycosyl hydrolase
LIKIRLFDSFAYLRDSGWTFMEQAQGVSKWAKRLAWIPPIVMVLTPVYLFHIEKQLRHFRKTSWAYKKFMEASFSVPEEAKGLLPVSLRRLPFGEKAGVVLGSRLIEIRGVTAPYNASIIEREEGGYYCFFRCDFLDENVRGGLTAFMGCAELDADFQQTNREFISLNAGSRHAEDPRVVRLENKLMLIYNDLVHDRFSDGRVMCMGEVDLGSGRVKNITKFDPKLQQLEKNWVPFVYADQYGKQDVYFEYTVVPLKLLKVSGDHAAPLQHLPSSYDRNLVSVMWPNLWGAVRGGTPAQLVGDQYLAFFHSSFRDAHGLLWYTMGAYTFESHPPFRITGISNYPLLFEGIYATAPMNTADPLKRVIFPAGFVVAEQEGREVIHLSCGENDSSVKVITLDKEKLLQSLKRIKLKDAAI